MADEALAFCQKNKLSVAIDFESATPYVVCNPRSIGVVPPKRIRGEGETLEEALKRYMARLVDERGEQKVPLIEYVKEAIADPDVVDAVANDEKMPPPVVDEEPKDPEEVVKGV